jgi:hypothetical protein
MDPYTSFYWILLLTIPSIAFCLNTLSEGWALKTFSKIPWEKSLNAAAVANLFSIPTLALFKYLFSHWDKWLPYNPLGTTTEILIIWVGATTIANAIELYTIRYMFSLPTTLGFITTTTLANGLTALADLWESLQKSL